MIHMAAIHIIHTAPDSTRGFGLLQLRPSLRLQHLGLHLVNLDELPHGKVKQDVLGPAGDSGAHDFAVEHCKHGQH